MCEYCGCQSLNSIDELTREHDAVVNLIGAVRSARAGQNLPRMAELARRITTVLGPHTRVEEDGLFPALVADFPDHIATLLDQHRLIEAVLGEAATGAPTDPTWPSRLADALYLLREHILAEQDGVFPAALASLDASQWDTVEAVRARVGTALSRGLDLS